MTRQKKNFVRKILQQLGIDRLRQLNAHFDLDIADRRFRRNHIQALCAAGVDLREALGLLTFNELKEVCAALKLKSGRSKQACVDSILAHVPAEPRSPQRTPSTMRSGPTTSTTAGSGEMKHGDPEHIVRDPAGARVDLVEMNKETGRLLGEAVAEVAQKAIEPTLAPFKQELDTLCKRMETLMEEQQDARERHMREMARTRHLLQQLLGNLDSQTEK